jgi:hypothetical protein
LADPAFGFFLGFEAARAFGRPVGERNDDIPAAVLLLTAEISVVLIVRPSTL